MEELFLIATRNEEGDFVVWRTEDEGPRFMSKEDAGNEYVRIIEDSGRKEVMLLRQVPVNVTIHIKIEE